MARVRSPLFRHLNWGTAEYYLMHKARLLYRGTPNHTFNVMLTMARRPVNATTIAAGVWNFHTNRPAWGASSIPACLVGMEAAEWFHKDRERVFGAMLNSKGISLLKEIGLRDETHGKFVDAYLPIDYGSTFAKWKSLSDFNRSALNPENDRYANDYPF